MKNEEKKYFIKKYFKDNGLQILIGMIITVLAAIIIGNFARVTNIFLTIICAIIIYILMEIRNFIKYINK